MVPIRYRRAYREWGRLCQYRNEDARLSTTGGGFGGSPGLRRLAPSEILAHIEAIGVPRSHRASMYDAIQRLESVWCEFQAEDFVDGDAT